MTSIPHPFTMTIHAAQRRADLYALVDGERRGHLAQQRTARHRPWTNLAVMVTLVAVIALGLAAGAALAQDIPHPARPSLEQADGRTVTQAPAEHLLDPSAARQVQATRL